MARQRQPRIVYLSTVRRRLKWTQDELADRSGVSQPNISRLENQPPTDLERASTRRRLAAALAVDPELLRFGPDPAVVAARRSRRAKHADKVAAELDAIFAAGEEA